MQTDCEFPINIVRATDFYLPINYVIAVNGIKYPINISGWSARLQVRKTVGSTGTPLVDISTAAGTIIMDGPNGKIELIIPKAVTVTIPVGQWVYDCLVTHASGWTEQIIFGAANVSERTTK